MDIQNRVMKIVKAYSPISDADIHAVIYEHGMALYLMSLPLEQSFRIVGRALGFTGMENSHLFGQFRDVDRDLGSTYVPFTEWDEIKQVKVISYLCDQDLYPTLEKALEVLEDTFPPLAVSVEEEDDPIEMDGVESFNVLPHGMYKFQDGDIIAVIYEDFLTWYMKQSNDLRQTIRENHSQYYYASGYNTCGRDAAVLFRREPQLVAKDQDTDSLMVIANHLGKMGIRLRQSEVCNTETCFILDVDDEQFSYVVTMSND